ncbi:hypothetical protein Glove_155g43 [Diversispora epigaea]|uniref:Protein kinase domain-containing protein n=1 Tax=Diversispora epigaea TaxID=1348612 RepID=A0A397IUZ3_9GLOM|nr:hypothetical protein Glove_155g43 [Diversispora epigaea]
MPLIGNAAIDDCANVIEWVPYDKFQDIRQIAIGRCGTIYYARWVGGFIDNWDIENKQWERWSQIEVALKKFNGVDMNEEFLNEVAILLKTNFEMTSTRLYGITKDPGTHKYTMILQYFGGGNLRNYLNNNFDWNDKLYFLKSLANDFSRIHKLDIVHCDFHPGNILKYSLESKCIYISDFGLSKLVKENIVAFFSRKGNK